MKYKATDAITCWPEDEYEATISGVKESTSKTSGAEMEVVSITVYNAAGHTMVIDDYIVGPSANGPGTIFKLQRIAKALGKAAEFENETFQVSKNIGSNIRVKLKIQKSDIYDDKNTIAAYLPSKLKSDPAGRAPVPTTVPPKQHPTLTEDDIPFDLAPVR